MKKHRDSIPGIVLVILVLLFAGCTTQTIVDEIDEIRIGVLLPLSGPLSVYGESALNAIELYFDEVNRNGGVEGMPINYVVEDNGGERDNSVRMAIELIEQDRVQAILGPLTSGNSIAVGKVCQQRGVPMICPTATGQGVTEVSDFVFRVSITEHYQAFIIAKFAVESLNSKRAGAIAFADDPFGQEIAAVFEQEYGSLGGGSIKVQVLEPDPARWSANIKEFENFQPDVIYVPTQLDRIEELLPRLRERGVQAVPLGSAMWLSIDPKRTAFEGSYFVDHYSPQTYEEQSRRFVAAYEGRFGPLPDSIPALAYESALILVEAFRQARSLDPARIRDTLALTDTETLIGRFRFDDIGDPVKPAIIRQVKSGNIRYVVSIYPEVVTEEEFKEQIVPVVAEDRENLPLVAVLNLALSGIPEAEAAIIVDLVGSAMANTGAFRVLERGQRDKMLEELEFSYSDMADERMQIEIGKQLATDWIITGSLGALADRYILNIKLIDVERGETLSASYQVYKSMNDLIDTADRLVVDLVSKSTF